MGVAEKTRKEVSGQKLETPDSGFNTLKFIRPFSNRGLVRTGGSVLLAKQIPITKWLNP
jgi:hypothetical protein